MLTVVLLYNFRQRKRELRVQRFTSSTVLSGGFTIVEVSVIIVVMAILLAVSVQSVIGYQENARDSERYADTEVITKGLERYYRTQSVVTGATYPPTSVTATTLTNFIESTAATTAPGQTSSSLIIASTAGAQTPTVSQYIYQPLNVNGTLCTAAPCVRYDLYYRIEKANALKVMSSMRQQ